MAEKKTFFIVRSERNKCRQIKTPVVKHISV